MEVSFGNKKVHLKVFKAMEEPSQEDEDCFMIDVMDDIVTEAKLHVLINDPLEKFLTIEDSNEYNLDGNIDVIEQSFQASVIRHQPYLSKPEPLPPLRSTPLPTSLEQAPILELKTLPENLKYVFLGRHNTLPVIISSLLTRDQESILVETLRKYPRAIGWSLADLKGIDPSICMHRINVLEESKPCRQPQRRLNPNMKEVVKGEIIKLLEAGIIFPVPDSQWVSPTHMVPKKTGTTVIEGNEGNLLSARTATSWRMCIDYRKLNTATRKDYYPLPFIDQILERLSGQEFYCFFNGYSGYNQIAVHPDDYSKTTFTCPYGTFAYRRMPFGLCNAPATFQRCMTAIFADFTDHFLEVFMDDFSIFGSSFENCLSNLEQVLQKCIEVNLMLSWEKSHFMVQQGIVLGHVVSQRGLEVDRAKVEVISNLKPPTNIRQIRAFLGHAGFTGDLSKTLVNLPDLSLLF